MALALALPASGGHRVDRSTFKNTPDWERYVCPKCHLLLRDAVQSSCGHRMCQVCVDSLFEKKKLPTCPECGEELVEEDGAKYFPDRFVRREIQNLPVFCMNRSQGCDWEGAFKELMDHQNQCKHGNIRCEFCGLYFATVEEVVAHENALCSKAPRACPCASIGCSEQGLMSTKNVEEHISGNLLGHIGLIVQAIPMQAPSTGLKVLPQRVEADGDSVSDDEGCNFSRMGDEVDRDGPEPHLKSRSPFTALEGIRDGKKEELDIVPTHSKSMTELKMTVTPPHSQFESGPAVSVLQKQVSKHVSSLRDEMNRKLSSIADEARRREEDVVNLKVSVSKLEKMVRAKNAEIEDRDFRLSLIENSNYDGTMVWKIPQFSQRMEDAKSGKYTSIFSLPFYTNRYGYKMCLRLYILGDGIGKGSHMSLFFVIMRGEFDNILQWPFTHKVTFRLINQTGARDITDTFQPDPMSSSFKKPKSDMNIASGCPRFVSLDELQSGGFIVDETVFIKCTIDKTTIRNP